MTAIPMFNKKGAPPPVIVSAANPSGFEEGRQVIGPFLAEFILNEMNYAGQRTAAEPHVEFLADHMQRGTFRDGSQIAFARVGEKFHLVNGQHRLRAIIKSGVEVEFQFLVIPAADDAEVAAIYYTFDRGGRVRSDSEVLHSVGVGERYGLTATMARGVWQAQPLIANDFNRVSFHQDPTRRNDDFRLAGCEPLWPLAAEFEAILLKAPSPVKKRLSTGQAVASALVILKHQPISGRKFWEAVAGDDGLKRNDPCKSLLIDLAGREWRRQSLDGCFAIATAWNAYYEGRPLTQIKVLNNARLRFAGTPIGRGR